MSNRDKSECVCDQWASSAPSFQSTHSLHLRMMPRQQVYRDAKYGRLGDLADWLCASHAAANHHSIELQTLVEHIRLVLD